MENESQQQGQEHSVEQPDTTEKRYRRKSVRRQLQDVITKLGKVADDPHQKPAKKVDALLRQSEVLMTLQKMDAEEADQTLQDEHAALVAQHAADAARITELEADNARLRDHRCEEKVVTRIDPESQKLRDETSRLQRAFDFSMKQIAAPEQTAIRAIREVPDVADMICSRLGIKYNEYRQYLMTYTTEQSLLGVIERAQVDDSSLLRFCLAALSVLHSLNLASPKPKRGDIHSVQEELIERERQENADRQATMNIAWRSQMGL